MKFSKKFTFLIAVVAGACWGTYGTFSSILRGYGIDAATISMVVPMAYTIFFFFLLCFDDLKKLGVAWKTVPFLVLFGLGTAIFNYSTVQAYQHLPIAIVSIIIYCNLFLLMIFSRFVFKDKITRQKGLAAICAVFGIALVVNIFSFQISFSLVGLIWALSAMCAWAIAVILEKYILNKGVDGNALMVYNGFFSIFFLCLYHSPADAVGNIAESVVASNGMVLIPFIAFALLTSICSYFCFITALKHLEPSYVQLGFVMDPLVSSILGFVVFGQLLAPSQIAGILLIILTVVWVQWTEIKKSQQNAPASTG